LKTVLTARISVGSAFILYFENVQEEKVHIEMPRFEMTKHFSV
jgi:hypothetical protein